MRGKPMMTIPSPKPCELSNPWSEVLQNTRRDAVREERRRFANELHDVVSSHLNATTLLLTAAMQSLPPGEVRDLIDQAATGVRECWSDARQCAKGLRPSGLVDRELTAVLADYARQLSIASGVNVTFASAGTTTPISEDTKLALLRVTQEAATNAIRHARPSRVSIELRFSREGVGLKVSDDGAGFDTARVPDGIGLSSMRDRARQIGAQLVIRSDPSHGTQVALTQCSRNGPARHADRPDEASPESSSVPLFPVLLYFAGRSPSGSRPDVDAPDTWQTS